MRFLIRPLRHFSIKKEKKPISFDELIFLETECKNCYPDCKKKNEPIQNKLIPFQNQIKPWKNKLKQNYPNKNVQKIIDDFLYNKKK